MSNIAFYEVQLALKQHTIAYSHWFQNWHLALWESNSSTRVIGNGGKVYLCHQFQVTQETLYMSIYWKCIDYINIDPVIDDNPE